MKAAEIVPNTANSAIHSSETPIARSSIESDCRRFDIQLLGPTPSEESCRSLAASVDSDIQNRS